MPISGRGYNVLPHELSRHQEGWAADCHGQPFPSINSRSKIEQNTDGSYELYCGLQLLACPPASNWLKTNPGQGYLVALWLYGSMQPFFDQT
jgi:hypothetical protein